MSEVVSSAGEESGERDPVCGMQVTAAAEHRVEHQGVTYYFCCARCRERFGTAPDAWLRGEVPDAPPAAPDAIYTCPMHPEVESVGPASCPACGMALEPA